MFSEASAPHLRMHVKRIAFTATPSIFRIRESGVVAESIQCEFAEPVSTMRIRERGQEGSSEMPSSDDGEFPETGYGSMAQWRRRKKKLGTAAFCITGGSLHEREQWVARHGVRIKSRNPIREAAELQVRR